MILDRRFLLPHKSLVRLSNEILYLEQERDGLVKMWKPDAKKTVIIGKDGVVHTVHLGVSPTFRMDLTATLQELTQ